MVFLSAVGGLALVLLILDLWRLKQYGGLLRLESDQPAEVAAVWLQIARGYTLVRTEPEQGLYVWERGRRFDDGGILYYGQIVRDERTGRGRFIVGVIGHKFHRAEELAAARAQFVSSQLFHLAEQSAETALIRAGDPRTVHSVHPAMRHRIRKEMARPPAIDAPISSTALRFTLRAPLDAVTDAIGKLPEHGWRLIETASLSRGLVTQHRYCFADTAEHKDAGAEYLLELRWYDGDWAMLAIDWFPGAAPSRPSRKAAELEADIREAVERVRAPYELIE
jgi:hypothetical protein